MKAVFLVALLLATLLAGCTGGDAGPATGEEVVNKEDFTFAVGVGGIAGLLVDDRFRPIDLEDSQAEGEYQSVGFILVQETGMKYKTNANGEFTVTDLEPGSFTLRTSASGHEATPMRVTVREGQFTEASIVARRISSDNSAIITTEYSGFTPCALYVIALSFNLDCTGDESGDSFRAEVRLDYSGYVDFRYLVLEVKLNQQASNGAAWDGVARKEFDYDYASIVIFEGDYLRMHMIPGELSPDPPAPGTEVYVWENDGPFGVSVFGRGTFAEDIRQAYQPVHAVTSTIPEPTGYAGAPMRRGVGLQLGVRSTIIASGFIGELDMDPRTDYCTLC